MINKIPQFVCMSMRPSGVPRAEPQVLCWQYFLLSIFRSLSVILAHSPYCACTVPPHTQVQPHPTHKCSPTPMQIIDFVRAKIAAGVKIYQMA